MSRRSRRPHTRGAFQDQPGKVPETQLDFDDQIARQLSDLSATTPDGTDSAAAT
jgi:hypothetical protein